MKWTRIAIAVLWLAAAALPLAAQKASPESLFRDALRKERAEGQLREAIFQYERLVAEFPRNRQLAARALFQLAGLYDKLNDPRARVVLSRLARDYAGVEPYASRARTRLQAGQAAAQAGPFPEANLGSEDASGSPDGKLIVFFKDSDITRLYLRDVRTGEEKLLVNGQGGYVSNFAWSPDSTRLAYNYNHQIKRLVEIRIVQVPGGQITNIGVRGYPRAWTATDEIFYYRVNYPAGGVDWYLVGAGGGAFRKVYFESEPNMPSITPDATRVVTVRAKRLVMRRLDTGETRNITKGTGDESRPLVSLDGRLVAFAANYDGEWAVYVAPIDGELPVSRALKIATVGDAGYRRGIPDWWTRDGTLAFPAAPTEANVYRVNMDPSTGKATDAPQRLTQDAKVNRSPSISPDSRRIAYWTFGGSRVGFSLMDSDGANERPLLENNAVLPLAWRSPEEILFYNFRPAPGEKTLISAINIHTGAVQDVARLDGLYWHWVPARKELLHLYPGGGGAKERAALKARSLTDGTDRVVATIDYIAPFPVASPDGKRIAYTVYHPPDPAGKRLCELSVMSITGEFEGVLMPRQEACMNATSWSPDGKFLLAGIHGKGLYVVNVQTRESWPLHAETTGQEWSTGSWAPDGSFVAITRSITHNEVLGWTGVTYEAVKQLLQPTN